MVHSGWIVLQVYDITNYASFQNLEDWLEVAPSESIVFVLNRTRVTRRRCDSVLPF